MKQLDIRSLLNGDDLFIFGRDTRLDRSQFLQNVEKYFHLLKLILNQKKLYVV